MTYKELKELERIEAIRLVCPPEYKLTVGDENLFPEKSEVIVFGGNYSDSDDDIVNFINEFVHPETEKDVQDFFRDIAKSITHDPVLADNEAMKAVTINYKLLYKQHIFLYSSPDKLGDWSKAKGTYIWLTEILTKRRHEQFLKIKKPMDSFALDEISLKIKKVYGFSDLEIIYLQYFCSQSKLDDLDPSNNTFLYCWSKKKRTGKTTVSSYIVSFLNGEISGDASEHSSSLPVEMMYDKFDKPNAISSRATLLDEAAHHDMTKVYNSFKQIITSNSCKIEFKYKNGKQTVRCHRNYVMNSNDAPEYFVMDEEERRILPIHFNKPELMEFSDIKDMWYKFVLECNFSTRRMQEIYDNIIQPNSQVGDTSNIMMEFRDIFTKEKINGLDVNCSYFNVSQVMKLPEIVANRKITRRLVKDVLISLYGLPDKNQRFYKLNREILSGETIDQKPEDLPF